ncbi:MAG: family 16 glycoside hydrolase, partial [Pirellulaceae bacterium]
MNNQRRQLTLLVLLPCLLCCCLLTGLADETSKTAKTPKAFIDGTGPGWQAMEEKDFVDVNGNEDTWTFKDGMIACTGQPVGVIRTAKEYKNLELVVEWRHLKYAGNSGVFLWAPEEVLKDLPKGKLPPGGIEVQVLDLGYTERFVKNNGKQPDWFTSHGDVFPVGSSTMTPFAPAAPNKRRSFPRKELSKGVGEW